MLPLLHFVNSLSYIEVNSLKIQTIQGFFWILYILKVLKLLLTPNMVSP